MSSPIQPNPSITYSFKEKGKDHKVQLPETAQTLRPEKIIRETPTPSDKKIQASKGSTESSKEEIVQTILGTQNKNTKKIEEKIASNKENIECLSMAFSEILKEDKYEQRNEKLINFLQFSEKLIRNYFIEGKKLPGHLRAELENDLETLQMLPLEFDSEIIAIVNEFSYQLKKDLIPDVFYLEKIEFKEIDNKEEKKKSTEKMIEKIRTGKIIFKKVIRDFQKALIAEMRHADLIRFSELKVIDFADCKPQNKLEEEIKEAKAKNDQEKLDKLSKPSPLVLASDNMNFRSLQVINDIMQCKDLKQVDRMIEFYMEVAIGAVKDRNYQGAMGIFGAINNAIVDRKIIANSLDGMKNSKTKKQYDEAIQVLSSENNYKKLRDKIEEDQKEGISPIPYFGLFTRDLTFIRENPDPEVVHALEKKIYLKLFPMIEAARAAPRPQVTAVHLGSGSISEGEFEKKIDSFWDNDVKKFEKKK